MNAKNRGGQVGPSRFATVVRALVWMAQSDGVSPSASIACQVKSHATFLRRMMVPLVRAGIVEAREGRDGGYVLRRPAEKITLAEVFRAVQAAGAESTECAAAESECRSESGLEIAFKEIMTEAEEQALTVLERYTIGGLTQSANALQRTT